MATNNTDIKTYLEILEILNHLIDEAPWDASRFLQATQKKLSKIRDEFQTSLNLTETTQPTPRTLADRVALRAGQVEIYVSLYNADGKNINKWRKLSNRIEKLIISRPIYRSEDDVRALIRSKVHKINEAYIAVYVSKTDIIPPVEKDQIAHDRLGHELLKIKEGAIKPENITRFMHATGQYVFKDNQLIKQGELEYMDFL